MNKIEKVQFEELTETCKAAREYITALEVFLKLENCSEYDPKWQDTKAARRRYNQITLNKSNVK